MSDDIEKLKRYTLVIGGMTTGLYDMSSEGDWVNYKDIKPFLDELERLREATRWISVKDKIPSNENRILVLHGIHLIRDIASLEKGVFRYDNGDMVIDVKYWMPLPEPPTEERS